MWKAFWGEMDGSIGTELGGRVREDSDDKICISSATYILSQAPVRCQRRSAMSNDGRSSPTAIPRLLLCGVPLFLAGLESPLVAIASIIKCHVPTSPVSFYNWIEA